ncbi:hypothetical protein QYE76_000572 [Lolium multiflorum]|uniref:non-specific serine/threonine protein kinase n=1 Tax=Lolium multiflorum TaxID=4521 RepID=A0AAD8RKE6_LOLMU|nr:hypothetical protein QYE76_000572 [Lolium multiflorum]
MGFALFATVLLLLHAPVAVPTSADETKTMTDEQLLERFKAAVRNKRELGGWTCGDSVCQFPGAGCVGSRLSTLSLAGVPLDVDFRAIATTLLRLSGVQKVSLRGANVTGSLADDSSGRWRCSHMLAQLDLSGNGALLRGHVADAAVLAGACGGLRELNLSRNALVGGRKGDRGAAGFAGLDVLDLSYNRIAGDLSWIASAVGVRHLGLAGNMISGLIPLLSNCSRMESLDLSRNDISGEVAPGVISGCSSLVTLDLSNNLLTGAFPPDILGFASLSYLNLSFNNFSDGLPAGDSLAAGIPRVATLSLSYNYFNGSLPDTMGSLAELTTLELNSNELTGVIPPSLCPSTGTSKLEVLHLQNNYLTGGIPPSISNCANLQSLDLALNYINGSIPTSLGDLTLLRDLILWENQLHGEIPASLAGARWLQHLILDYNGLTGGIPPELVYCQDLIWLSLGSNKLSGPVPAWLGRLDSMANLKLNNNSFSGTIPPELGDCKQLILLDLNDNQLSGPIPPELARQSGKVPILDTGRTSTYLRNQGSRTGECHGSGNLLHTSGIRSDDLNRMASKKLCNFTVLHLSSPEFASTLNASMAYLDLSFNQLNSEIPKELGNMNYLFLINLGSNLLSGAIPDELGDAKTLSSLDLSHNQLEGPIPGSLSTLGLLQYIDLSYNKLNGSVPVLGSLATFPESQYENNSGLCGIPLPPCLPISSLHGGRHSGHNYHPSNLIILLACVTVALAVIGFFLYLAMIKKTEKGQVRASVDDPVGHQLISHLELVRATNNFNENNMLGSGGFGKVFRGQLSNGLVVAVKVLDMRSEHTTRSFDAECRVLRMARHRNLIQVINTCSNMDFRALVLQYMPNGSLDTLLHHSHLREMQFGFHERLGVMLDVSMALEYLHHGYHEVVLHCDLKPSNVLFDEDMIAHVADFGIARLLQGNDSSTIASNMPGSIGYMSPEYGSYGKASRKSDVFSYGIMLIEVFTGRKPEDAMFVGDLTLRRWVQQLFPAELIHAVDARLLHGSSSWCELHDNFLVPIIEIGLLCTKDSPNDRIKISDVVLRLTKIQIAYTKWTTRHNDL